MLNALYARLEGGRTVEPGDIDRELRMGGSEAETGTRSRRPAGNVQRRQRSKSRPARNWSSRAPTRKRPMSQSLFDNELAFGIGPAGTGKTYLAVAVGV